MKVLDIVFFVLIFLLLISVIVMIVIIKNETSQCLKNPFIYGAKKMGDVSCSCVQYPDGKCPPRFYFNDTAFLTPVTKCEGEQFHFDLKLANITTSPKGDAL